MAIAAIVEFPEATLAQYDEVIRRLHSTPGGSAPAGRLFHWVASTRPGIRITDVWESREQFDAFYRDHVDPIAADEGLHFGDTTFVGVHNYLAAGPPT
ncbi:hypothetical protein LVY72_21045 [Arthrobacter sp. I2-34]|uniref:ABM domain-containing protein n=1 Tax=Arthrobacter hankyongi TaxID=2904801 RepID=A0ABS9LCH6_9MICC|nr:hypothetical protein [Arthrobacter hankyongi]MCG2624383.1 hypothetical protein [Arthrobacter hankyongi]